MVIFEIVCCHGNSLQHTHINAKEISGVLLIFTVNARSLNLKLKQIIHFQFFILLQVYVLLKLQGATLSSKPQSSPYLSVGKLVKTLKNVRPNRTSSSVCKHYDNDLLRCFKVFKKCMNKFDCLLNEMLYIKQLTPSLNVQAVSIRAKVFVQPPPLCNSD